MQSTIKCKIDSVLSIFDQAEDTKKGQTIQVLKAFEKEEQPRKPAEIAGITGLKQPSVRRIIQTLVRSGKVKRVHNNKYSIIK